MPKRPSKEKPSQQEQPDETLLEEIEDGERVAYSLDRDGNLVETVVTPRRSKSAR